MKTWFAAALCALALGSSAALAEADTFGVGSGRNGPLVVAGSGTVINSYAPVTAALAVGSTSVPIGACIGDTSCFVADDLVLVHQTTGLTPAPVSGTPDAVDLGTRPVGRWEFARVGSVTATTLELTAPLVHDYAANVTQVIRVPEHTNVSIAAGRSITAPPWDGSTGGIVAFLADGTVTNSGLINASSLGFRGGQYVNDTSASTGCTGPTALDQPAPSGAQKGEGIANTRYGATQTGRGNVANGAGGGVCFKSGGGGGGHGGAGGQGGRSEDNSGRDVGGLGGTALTYPALTQFTFGGGGGAGHAADGTGVPGGRGGGAIFIRAGQLTGTGTLTASGGLASAAASDGGSGGGAGGSIYLRFVRTADCAAISVTGGLGGNVNAIRVGPGGGGAGGRVLFQAAGGTCPIIATGSASGVQQESSEPAYGAQPGTNGTSDVRLSGFVVPEPPTIITPPNGSVTSNRRPPITGQALPAGAAIEVILYIDGTVAGRTTSDASGNYTFTPPADLSDGPHTVQAVSEVLAVRSLRSAINTFTVDTTPPDTSIVSGPSGFTRQTTATFEFSATEPDVTYECSLNDAVFTPCPSPATFSSLAEGAYTLQVRARDAAGNVDETPATRSFRVTGADLALLGSGCSATGGDASWLLLGLSTLSALTRRQRRKSCRALS
ncbi:Ig-like domain-containing protein [Archangium violaceum]|uniref:adventurous gliding motility protein AgmC n=1 Tax=Archangium violaceum TaxID=83451 RepID=UPI002B2BC441|nr:Ig-like domain-containing protein [Archangium gephyra]